MDENAERVISVSVRFQYKGPNAPRPEDYGQMANLTFDVPYGTPVTTVPIPSVGDTVVLKLASADRPGAYKVLTRNFGYLEGEAGLFVSVNIVVTDVDPEEMSARLKE